MFFLLFQFFSYVIYFKYTIDDMRFIMQVYIKYIATVAQRPRERQWKYTITSSNVQAGFRKGRGTRDQSVNICWIIATARESQRNIYFYFIDYAKAFDCVDHNKLSKILKEIGILNHLTCLLRNLCASQVATVRTGHWKTDWFQIGKGVCQGYIKAL